MNVVLISTYELGHQPFGLASPAAWLRQAGATVTCMDAAVEQLEREALSQADLIAFYLPMHTATRIAIGLVKQVKGLNPAAHLCFYGLYAPVNATFLRKLGADTLLGGEFESGLLALYQRLKAGDTIPQPQSEPVISLDRQIFLTPDRRGLPELSKYAYLERGPNDHVVAGYTEASRGCKHLCRHCPVVPVYEGRFRVVDREVVLADITQQVAAGAAHITFGDPDFFNGPGHAIPLVQSLHEKFPQLTYDVTIKVEHLLQQADLLPVLKETGCSFITSAVEAVDDQILHILDKGHNRADFVKAVACLREVGLSLNPTFVAFNPWITLEGYLNLLSTIADLTLVEHVAPIQYAIRLLIPAGSLLLTLPGVQTLVGDFDEAALVYPWQHPDPQVDHLQQKVLNLVQEGEEAGQSRAAIFEQVWHLAYNAYQRADQAAVPLKPPQIKPAISFAPRLSEPWYC